MGSCKSTRSLGDLRLKNDEFNSHNFSEHDTFRKPIPRFNGPYLGTEPDI